MDDEPTIPAGQITPADEVTMTSDGPYVMRMGKPPMRVTEDDGTSYRDEP